MADEDVARLAARGDAETARLSDFLVRDTPVAYAFIAPAFFLLLFLVAYPFVLSLWFRLPDPYLAMFTVVLVNTWRGLPFFAITLLAGLVAIPRELYEAAESDGAGPVGRFWHVTVPLLKPVLAVVFLFSAIFTLADFNIVYVLTKGGPMNMTHLFATYSFVLGLQSGHIGQGAAVSLFLFPILLALVFTQLRMVRKAAMYD